MSSNDIMHAAAWASEKHAGQERKHNGTPYIRHPQRVAARAMCLEGMSVQGVIAAFLHDVPEECGGNEYGRSLLSTAIEVSWGAIVRDMVRELTPVTLGLTTTREMRKKMERGHLARARRESKRIKLLDRIDNLQEVLCDMQRGVNTSYSHSALYVAESRQLLEDSLRGADAALEEELMSTIEFVGKWMQQQAKKL